jgi:ureidoacrylate peracid hydrolase
MSRGTLSREVPIDPAATAVLFIDVQNFSCRRDGGEFKHMDADTLEAEQGEFFRALEQRALPAMQRLQAGCRAGGVEVMYTVIEALTRDCRDMSLDYKITGFHVPRGSWDAQVLDEIAPADDEIIIPKTSSSVFVSTNIDYVLRSLGVKYLILAGCVTDQCVEGAVRDACDLGYLVTLVPEACATATEERHNASLRAIKGYCRMRTVDELLAEMPVKTDAAAG